MFELLDGAHGFSEFLQAVLKLPPALRAELRAKLEQHPHGVVQQVDVGWKVYVSLHHERVTAACGGRGAVFFTEQGVAGLHHRLVDAGQDLRREQGEIVLERL